MFIAIQSTAYGIVSYFIHKGKSCGLMEKNSDMISVTWGLNL